jgi:hypothetical protein
MINLTSMCRFYMFYLMLALILGGCGSGSGTASSSRTTKVKTSVKTAGLASSGLLVGAMEVVISFPYGVTAELDPVTNEPARSVVQLVGTSDPAMTMNALTYVAATPTTRGSLKIYYFNAKGFTPSDSLSVQLDIATGFFPQGSDFSLSKFEIVTMTADGNTINSQAPVPNPVFTAEVI